MKLIVTIDLPEKEILAALDGIPKHWFSNPQGSPIRLIAKALKDAYENAREREEMANGWGLYS